MAESYHFDRLAREIIASQLKNDPQATTHAAQIACKTIVAGIKGTKAAGASQDSRESVRQICHGTMAGLLLLEANLSDGALAIMENIAEASQEVQIDPSEMMTWAMEGISRISTAATPEVIDRIRQAIESKFMGAGEIFSKLCEQVRSGSK